MTNNKVQRKKKLMQWGYALLIWVIPFLYLTLFPYLLNYTKNLARDEISFGPNASSFYQNLTVFILPIVFNLFIGAGVFILGSGIKNHRGKAIHVGCILGVIYSFLILFSYLVYFNINIPLINQLFRLGMYTGPGNPSFILAFYGFLLYRIVRKIGLAKESVTSGIDEIRCA